jgi:hypothetical protein
LGQGIQDRLRRRRGGDQVRLVSLRLPEPKPSNDEQQCCYTANQYPLHDLPP